MKFRRSALAIELFVWALRLGLAAVLLYAGLVKAGDSEQFAFALAPFTFVPEAAIEPLALLLPWIEILLGVALLLPRVHRPAALLSACLFLIFIAALAWAVSEDIVVSCGCFGEEDEPPSIEKMQGAIARDVVFALAALCVAFRPSLRIRNPESSQS